MIALDSLIVRARDGDLDACGELVRRFQDMAVGYAYAQLGDFHLAEDAAQEALVAACDGLPKLQVPAAFTSWFRQILKRQCLQQRRRKPLSVVPLDAVKEPVSATPQPDRVVERDTDKQRLLAAVQELPAAQREAVSLFYISRYSQRQIADFLGITPDTVKNRLRSGRGRLKERMLAMAADDLRQQAPSRDDRFATVVDLCNAARQGDLQRLHAILDTAPELARKPITQNGQLAIQFAAREGHADIVGLLLEAGADPQRGVYPNRRATTALAYARDRGHEAVVRLIEDHIARHPAPDPSPDQAARLLAAVAAGDAAAATALLENDAALANTRARVDAARIVAEVEIATDKKAIFPLRLAAETGSLEMARLLLDHGADPDAPFDMDLGDEGVFRNAGEPLWLAAAGGHYELCKLLLERGADPNAYVFASGPAAERAMENGHDDILDLIYSYGGKDFAVAAALCGRIAVPAEVMALKPEAAPGILWGAALGGNLDLVRLCLSYDLGEVDWFGLLYQPLRGRCNQARLRYADGRRDEHEDKVEILRMVLEAGADPNATDGQGMTPLHRLVGEVSHWQDAEKIAFARLLLDYGAKLEVCDEELQSTPLGHAAHYGHTETVAYLLERGAQANCPEGPAWATPLARALKQGRDEVAVLLKKSGATA